MKSKSPTCGTSPQASSIPLFHRLKLNTRSSFFIGTALMLLVGVTGFSRSEAPTYHMVRSFNGLGSHPTSLLEGTNNHIYGTFRHGGSKWEGAVFQMKKDGSGYAVLHNFEGGPREAEGVWPEGVIDGGDGALYGITQLGGHPVHQDGSGGGTVFKLKMDGSGYTVLHQFGKGGEQGFTPCGLLVQGKNGVLYGTTREGGVHGAGVIFKIKKDGTGYSVLHQFSGGDADGARPIGGVSLGSDGLLYGTTEGGGKGIGSSGTLFRMKTDGTSFTILHHFPTGENDGLMPKTRLIEGPDGALYGTTSSGGNNDAGTLFKINKDGNGYTILHRFTGSVGLQPDPNGTISGVLNGVPTKFSDSGDGANPVSLILAPNDVLVGATEYHGKNGGGTLFQLKITGTGFSTLHHFGNNEQDGQNPAPAIFIGTDSITYGMTDRSKNESSSTLYQLKFQ